MDPTRAMPESKATYPYALTTAGNANMFATLFCGQVCHVIGTWQTWQAEHDVWIPDSGFVIGVLAHQAIMAARLVVKMLDDPDQAERLLRHLQASDDSGPYTRMTKMASRDPRIARDPLTWDPEHHDPVTVDPEWPALDRARDSFWPSRWACKLREIDGYSFAVVGPRTSTRSKLYILDHGEYIRCNEKWWANAGPLEFGGDWRALYGSLTTWWLKATSPELDDARAALAAETEAVR
jgi:hypothetical protein